MILLVGDRIGNLVEPVANSRSSFGAFKISQIVYSAVQVAVCDCLASLATHGTLEGTFPTVVPPKHPGTTSKNSRKQTPQMPPYCSIPRYSPPAAQPYAVSHLGAWSSEVIRVECPVIATYFIQESLSPLSTLLHLNPV